MNKNKIGILSCTFSRNYFEYHGRCAKNGHKELTNKFTASKAVENHITLLALA